MKLEVVAIESNDRGAQWAICEGGRIITTGTLDDMLKLSVIALKQDLSSSWSIRNEK